MAQRPLDDLGLANGYIKLATQNFNIQIVKDAQFLSSLQPAGDSFDFLPLDYLSRRARNGQYHWGDITFRYRQTDSATWIDGNTAASRQPVTTIPASGSVLASSNLTPTLGFSSSPLNITREWLNVSGDLGLRFTLQNTGTEELELGSVGFPAEFNSIFTNRLATEIQHLCSLSDPYVGMDAGYIRVSPLKCTGSALVVTPLVDTTLEVYKNLNEPYYADTDLGYGSQTFEGFYEWQVLTQAWAENEWANAVPWNAPSSRTLSAGESVQFGLRFSVVEHTGTPVAKGVPGYVIPRDLTAQLLLKANSSVGSITTDTAESLVVEEVSAGSYTVMPSASSWGRVRLTVEYTDGKIQTVHYYITKSTTEAVRNLGQFLTTEQCFNNTSDPFGRAPSVMTYDHETKSIVEQDSRAWVAGLSDEAGSGSFLAAVLKQAVQPVADEVFKLEGFVDGVLWETIQTSDFAVQKSIFYYEPSAVRGFTYDSSIDWTSWTSWNKAAAYGTDRAYDYVHVAASYWALYRLDRAYPDLVNSHAWDWYLNQAYCTIMRAMQSDVGYNRVGLMGETVFGEILADLKREGLTSEASTLTEAMRSRAEQWNSEEVPYGSEMAWNSTGQEGVYYWTKYFGFTTSETKTIHSVLGYMPTVPHWGWNGNARRYWDNMFVASSSISFCFFIRIFLALGSGTYVAQDGELGLLVYGGVIMTNDGATVTVQNRDPVRKRVFIGPLGLLITVDAGIIQEFSFTSDGSSAVSVKLTQLDGVPKAKAAVLWTETNPGSPNSTVMTEGVSEARLGWQISLADDAVTEDLGPA